MPEQREKEREKNIFSKTKRIDQWGDVCKLPVEPYSKESKDFFFFY